MKKEITIHLTALFVVFVLIAIFKKWLSLDFWPFWVGGLIGTFLPDVDHLIYVYFLRPHELTSQRTARMFSNKDYWEMVKLLVETRKERNRLIFHSAFFQVIFVVLAFLIITSSGSVFGIGLVLAFYLHLLTDQFIDLVVISKESPRVRMDNRLKKDFLPEEWGEDPNPLENWFKGLKLNLSKEKAVFYWLGMLLIFIFFAFFL